MKHRNKTGINFEYFHLVNEFLYFWIFACIPKKKATISTRSALILNSCLIGEFIKSLPAIVDFMKRNPELEVDLVVAPSLLPLAQNVRGIRKVYVAASVYGRDEEKKTDTEAHLLQSYDSVIVLRMNKESYQLARRVRAGKFETNAGAFTRYVLHLGFCNLTRRAPRQWKDFNFALLGGKPHEVPIEQIFFEENIEKKPTTPEKTVVIHTGSNWPMKKWSNAKWASLLDKIHAEGNFNFLIVGRGKDQEDFEYLSKNVHHAHLVSHIDKHDLVGLWKLLRASDYFIGIDSGPANMAHIALRSSVTIYGPGPHMYFPSGPHHKVLDKSHGRGLYQMFFCVKDSFIEKITVDEVFDVFMKVYRSGF